MLPDFNRLKVFYYVFREESSTEAARQLHITQSGVSQHLKKLEEELQVSLFTRVNKRLIPTASAQKLYDIISEFIGNLERGIRDINAGCDIPSGELRIGVPTEFGKTYLPAITASFREQYPDVTFCLELGDPNHLFKQLHNAELDFAYIDILPFYLDTPGGLSAYEITPIIKEEFIFACAKEYYQAHVAGADYETLSKLQYVGYKKDLALFRSWFDLHFNTAPSSLSQVFVADNSSAIISAIEAGMGIGVIVSHFISEQLTDNSIISYAPSKKKLENTIACVQLKNKTETLTESTFKEHFLKEVKEVPNITLVARPE